MSNLRHLGIDADEIIPHVWQGGFPGQEARANLPRAGFQVVVLAAREAQIPLSQFPPGITIYYLPLDDLPLPLPDITRAAVKKLARKLAAHVQHGENVLVTCAMGLNRSGLITGTTLKVLGMPGIEAVRKLRQLRDPQALSNPVFFAYVVRGRAS